MPASPPPLATDKTRPRPRRAAGRVVVGKSRTVFSDRRTVQTPALLLPKGLKPDMRIRMEGLEFLSLLPEAGIPVAFFDPQYRGILDRLSYGNEGKQRGRSRCALQQMPEEVIVQFIAGIDRVLISSGHLFLWMDKFHLCQGFRSWIQGTELDVVDLVSWDKGRLGMGYRSRRVTEYCVVLQKRPRKAKGIWKSHSIPDTWREPSARQNGHPHQKPVELQAALIGAVSNKGDFVIDPAAGSFSVMEAAHSVGCSFLGCDLVAETEPAAAE